MRNEKIMVEKAPHIFNPVYAERDNNLNNALILIRKHFELYRLVCMLLEEKDSLNGFNGIPPLSIELHQDNQRCLAKIDKDIQEADIEKEKVCKSMVNLYMKKYNFRLTHNILNAAMRHQYNSVNALDPEFSYEIDNTNKHCYN